MLSLGTGKEELEQCRSQGEKLKEMESDFQNLDVGTNRIKQSDAKKEAMAWRAQEWSRILREREVVCHSGNADRKGRDVGWTQRSPWSTPVMCCSLEFELQGKTINKTAK